MPPDWMTFYLAKEHQETRVSIGSGPLGTSIDLFISEGGATWSLVSRRGAMSCITAAGRNWRDAEAGESENPGA